MPRQKSRHVDDSRAVGERLKTARERARLSQRQLSFAGCSPAYISRIESGDRIPSLQLLRELGRRLGVSEDYLATGQEDPKPSQLMDADFALRLGDLERATELYEYVLAQDDTHVGRAQALEGLGHLAMRRGELRQAVPLFEEALAVAGRDACDRPTLAESLGRARAALGELTPAITLFERCFERFRKHGDRFQSVRFAVLLAYALIDSGDFARAERVIGEALAAGEELKDPVARARLYWSQYRLRAEQDDVEGASHYAHLALATLEATDNTRFIARAHQGIAFMALDGGRPEEALAHLHEGWPLIEESGTPLDKAHFRIEEARALARLGREEEAARLAMQIAGQLGDALPEDAGRTYALLGEIFAELGQPERAQELYELAAEYLERNNPNRYLADVYAKLADLHDAGGRREEAYGYMKKALGMQRSVASKARA